MKKNILEKVKKLNTEIESQADIYTENEELLKELMKDPLVLKALNLQITNEKILKNLKALKLEVHDMIENGCCHSLLLYDGYVPSCYDSYYFYRCLECGEVIESGCKMNNVIFSNVSYETIKKQYYDYLIKYDEEIAIQIMLARYNNELFNDLINSGVDEIKALKLVKK